MQIVGIVAPGDAGGDLDAVAARAARLVDEGADLVDVDTLAPGAGPPDLPRVVRLVRRLADDGLPVGVTTTSADVVVGAVDAGARIVADPSGGCLDPFMPQILAAAGIPFVLGQSIAKNGALRPATPRAFREGAERRVAALLEAGAAPDLIVVDSGVGQFARGDSRWEVLEHFGRLVDSGFPIVVDASWPVLFPPETGTFDPTAVTDEDDVAAIGVCLLAAGVNAWGVRVSNVARTAVVLGDRVSRSRHGVDAQTR